MIDNDLVFEYLLTENRLPSDDFLALVNDPARQFTVGTNQGLTIESSFSDTTLTVISVALEGAIVDFMTLTLLDATGAQVFQDIVSDIIAICVTLLLKWHGV